MEAQQKDFLLEEYKSLKTEIFESVAETRKMEVYAAGAVVALFAWFTANKPTPDGAWYIPAIIPFLGGIRSILLFKRIQDIAGYLRVLERAFLPEGFSPTGWENHFGKKVTSRLSGSGILFWVMLLITTLVMPCFLKLIVVAR